MNKVRSTVKILTFLSVPSRTRGESSTVVDACRLLRNNQDQRGDLSISFSHPYRLDGEKGVVESQRGTACTRKIVDFIDDGVSVSMTRCNGRRNNEEIRFENRTPSALIVFADTLVPARGSRTITRKRRAYVTVRPCRQRTSPQIRSYDNAWETRATCFTVPFCSPSSSSRRWPRVLSSPAPRWPQTSRTHAPAIVNGHRL